MVDFSLHKEIQDYLSRNQWQEKLDKRLLSQLENLIRKASPTGDRG